MGEFRGIELNDLGLDSERLHLRPWRRADADALVAALDAEPMHRFLALPRPYTKADATRFVKTVAPVERRQGTGLDCAVVERGTDSVVGSVSLRLPWRSRSCDIGYWTAPAVQGRGYAGEAVRLLTGWAHAQAGVHRVELRMDVRNLPSARVAMKSGFGFEGIRRDELADGEDRVDLAVFVHAATDGWDELRSRFTLLPPNGLSDGTVCIRPAVPDDLVGFTAQEHDPLTLYFTARDCGPSRAALLRVLNRARLDHLVGSDTFLTMVDVASGYFAGSLRLSTGAPAQSRSDVVWASGPPDVGELGYAVHPAFRGRGYTTRALRLLAAWAFELAGFARLELGTKIDNVASQRAALSAGFHSEGIAPGRLRNADGSSSDEARYALLHRDWSPR